MDAERRVCPSCGRVQARAAVACWRCGRRFEASADATPPADPPRGRAARGSKGRGWGDGLVVLAILSAVGFLLARDPSPAPPGIDGTYACIAADEKAVLPPGATRAMALVFDRGEVSWYESIAISRDARPVRPLVERGTVFRLGAQYVGRLDSGRSIRIQPRGDAVVVRAGRPEDFLDGDPRDLHTFMLSRTERVPETLADLRGVSVDGWLSIAPQPRRVPKEPAEGRVGPAR